MIKAISTKGMSREDWLSCRRLGLGGSDVGAVCGLSPYRTTVDVYLDKIEQKPEQSADEMTAPMYWGTVLEDCVAKEFSRRTGWKVQRINYLLKDEWRIANIDRVVSKNGKAPWVRGQLRTDTLLECKTASAYSSEHWGPSQESEIIAGNVTSEHKIPDTYETQVQWYMGITGCTRCYVAVLIGGNDFRMYQVNFDPDLYARLDGICERFWNDCVLLRTAPTPADADDAVKLYPVPESDDMAEANDVLSVEIGELRNINGRIAELKKEADAIKGRLCIAIGEKSGLTIAGEPACTWTAQTSRRFDATAFKAAYPDLYNEFTKQTRTRVFRVK